MKKKKKKKKKMGGVEYAALERGTAHSLDVDRIAPRSLGGGLGLGGGGGAVVEQQRRERAAVERRQRGAVLDASELEPRRHEVDLRIERPRCVTIGRFQQRRGESIRSGGPRTWRAMTAELRGMTRQLARGPTCVAGLVIETPRGMPGPRASRWTRVSQS